MGRHIAPVMDASQPTQQQARVRRLLIDLAVMTVIGVLLALLGPYGTFTQPLALRLAIWVGLAYAGYAIYSPVGTLVERMHRAYALPKLGLWIAGTLVATIPMAIVVWLLNALYGPLPIPSAERALSHYLNVLVIGAAVTGLMQVLDRDPGPAAEEPTPAPATKPANTFLARLDPSLGSDLLALEMEDHYVRAHTALGSELVLLRLRDAVAELDDAEGMQVHRSWWVARESVEDIKRDGRNVRLVLVNGIEAPVSRANVQVLKDAGWL